MWVVLHGQMASVCRVLCNDCAQGNYLQPIWHEVLKRIEKMVLRGVFGEDESRKSQSNPKRTYELHVLSIQLL